MVVPWVLRGGWHLGHGWARLPTHRKGKWDEQRQGPVPAWVQWAFVPQSNWGCGRANGSRAGQSWECNTQPHLEGSASSLCHYPMGHPPPSAGTPKAVVPWQPA